MSTKLNPLRTSFPIELQIDDITYKLNFKPVNKQIKEKLDGLLNENKEQHEESDSKRAELKEYISFKTLNEELLSTYSESDGIDLKQKRALLLENKNYLEKIATLEKELKKLERNLEDVNVAVETYYKEMLDSCISGEQKVSFFNLIDESGLSYALVNIYVNQAVRDAQEKK